jgi:hypothetical protein
VDAVAAMSALAAELGDVLVAVDVNPLICGPAGVLAADALIVSVNCQSGPISRERPRSGAGSD